MSTISRMKNYMTGAFWHGVGSDQRFTPRWYERGAYIEGLRDAARIVERYRSERWHDTAAISRAAGQEIERRIYERGNEIAPDLCSNSENP